MQNTIVHISANVYRFYVRVTSFLQPVLLLTIRIIWGWQFFQTGKGKLGNLSNVAQFFDSLHIPMPRFNAVLASCTECFGGLMLLLGLGGRLAALPLTITMLVAYLTAERPDIHSMDDFVKATPFPFLFTVLVVLAFGPGLFSLDAVIGRLFKKHLAPSDPRGFDVITQGDPHRRM